MIFLRYSWNLSHQLRLLNLSCFVSTLLLSLNMATVTLHICVVISTMAIRGDSGGTAGSIHRIRRIITHRSCSSLVKNSVEAFILHFGRYHCRTRITRGAITLDISPVLTSYCIREHALRRKKRLKKRRLLRLQWWKKRTQKHKMAPRRSPSWCVGAAVVSRPGSTLNEMV